MYESVSRRLETVSVYVVVYDQAGSSCGKEAADRVGNESPKRRDGEVRGEVVIAQIATKQIGEHYYAIAFPPDRLCEAYDYLAKWCLNRELNFDVEHFDEMAREMADNDPEKVSR